MSPTARGNGTIIIKGKRDPAYYRSTIGDGFRIYVVDAASIAVKHRLGSPTYPIANTATLIGSGPALSFSAYKGLKPANPVATNNRKVVDAKKIVYDYFDSIISEELSEICARGELDAEFIKVESEHSAMAALVGASSAGARTFTATSSQGLLYMHEMLHWSAGTRLPIVLVNVNRAVGAGQGKRI